MNFKVGDRVAIYGGLHSIASEELMGQKGTVIDNSKMKDKYLFPEDIYVQLDTFIKDSNGPETTTKIYVHPKQCRKLVKKAKPTQRPDYDTQKLRETIDRINWLLEPYRKEK